MVVSTSKDAANPLAPVAPSAAARNTDDSALEKLREKLEQAGIPTETYEAVKKDFERLVRVPKQSSEHDLLRSYLEVRCVVLGCGCVVCVELQSSSAPLCRGPSRTWTTLVCTWRRSSWRTTTAV